MEDESSTTPADPSRRLTTCSFCGKTSREVGAMVEGPGDVYMCRECVPKAHRVIQAMQREYACSFCGKTRPGSRFVEGPAGVHMCADCVQLSMDLFAKM